MSLDVYLEMHSKSWDGNDIKYDVFEANITHNMGLMAEKAGIYKELWRPEELCIVEAWQLIKPLINGLNKLKDRTGYFKQFNPANGWSDYGQFVDFVERYLNACIGFPNAIIRVSR